MTDVLKLASDLVEDQDLSEEDTRLILEAARERGKENPLTQKEIAEILNVVHEKTKVIEYENVPKSAKIIGALLIIFGSIGIISAAITAFHMAMSGQIGSALKTLTASSTVVAIITVIVTLATVVLTIMVGIKLRTGKRGRASILITTVFALLAVQTACEIMLYGIDIVLLDELVLGVVCIVASAHLNPSLKQETELKQGLRQIDTELNAQRGTLGLADPGKGFIRLDFFNIFWTFVVCCVLGLIVEIIFHMVVVEPGVYQDRAGLLFGPFSPIYGFGAVLMTVALNRFKDKNIIFIFVICTLIGGAFEYSVSWFMEIAFGAVAWDYHGKFLGDLFDGRTCLLYASMFGVLGLAWIKLLLPLLLKLINRIPLKLRYSLTAVCALLMIVDCCMTVQALDNWAERAAGHQPKTPIEQFYADYFGDDVMAKRFESMTLNPDKSVKH